MLENASRAFKIQEFTISKTSKCNKESGRETMTNYPNV